MEKIPLLDLKAQYRSIEVAVRSAMDRVLTSQHFILGPEVEALEKEIATYVDCQHGIGVTSGSDALLVALQALDVNDGDEVITTPYSFFATAGAIVRLGAKPVFVDIEPQTFNLDATNVERAITPKTKVILPVHLFGQACELGPLVKLAAQKNLVLLEDAAQALGTEYQGKRVGAFGLVSCFSFFPSKNLGAMGDAGMVTTQDSALAEKIRVLRSHGSKPKYFHKYVGGNFRIDALQAAILRAKFPHLDSWTQARQTHAARYTKLFQLENLMEYIQTPWVRPGDRHIFNQYVIRTQKRDELKKYLAERGIETEVYYPLPLHLQECFSYLGHQKGDFKESERAAQESLAIPVYPELSDSQQDRVVSEIKAFFLPAGRSSNT